MNLNFNKIMKKMMNTKRLVIILIIGIGLLLLPSLFPQKTVTEKSATSQTEGLQWITYEKELETRLADILETVRGVSNVSVMITLSDSGETYYAQNQQADQKTTDDGSLTEKNSETQGSLALKNDSGGGQSPILLKVATPRISGVLVTAKGVSNPTVQADVINAVRAVLNVSAHRVQVLEKA